MTTELNYSDISQEDNFIQRHIGPKEKEVQEMLDFLEIKSLEDLIDNIVPKNINQMGSLDLADAKSEISALKRIKAISKKNKVNRSLIGMGYFDTIMPPVIQRNVFENPGWYTAYTPYQPEISQGRLEAILNFQQMVIDMTGMEIANASMLDEATAAAEAMTLAKRSNKKSKSNRILVSSKCHPQTISILNTRAKPLDLEVVLTDDFNQEDAFAILVQYPDTNGEITDYRETVKTAKDNNQLVIFATDLLALTLLTPPGEMGADIVIGSAQRFGVPLGFGGPHAAFFATKDAFKRSMPGRIVGVSEDSTGRPALRLALQTREQHIRRDKATSNICTAQVLLANIAGFYAVYHGANGLKTIATRINALTNLLRVELEKLGFKILNQNYFDTLTINTGDKFSSIIEKALNKGFNFRIEKDTIAISLDEKSNLAEIQEIIEIFGGNLNIDNVSLYSNIPNGLLRTSKFLTHPNFKMHRSETEMMRYLRKLEAKDIALNRSMIALGSCTMKLNSASEMMPVTWAEFSNIHPYAPEDQTRGYQELITDLEDKLCKITGFDGMSLQPNAGSQGEYAGLLTIKAYHDANGNHDRNICLIPSSAHGTNPASAVMAGMKVVVIACDKHGNISIEDLALKVEEHKDNLAALMVTYPSTHGVFEEKIKDICELIHDNGGQVYLDGANLNAMVGIAMPGKFGADVAHLNLHKTFCIPHGGGGPGVGPIGVGKHLIPYLPGNPISNNPINPVSAANYGSASILPISWMYIEMMGKTGLTEATKIAILNANYIAKKLENHYPILYKGKSGLVAHECILDTRRFNTDLHISVDDIAKRLMDFGFHAPTMSWPVVHTLMVEPTESESKAELDRFINAMIKIREEISDIENKKIDLADSPLTNAPHTLETVTSDTWDRSYSRTEAAYPYPYLKQDKYWVPVSRIDNAKGDRNFVCTCPSLESYMD